MFDERDVLREFLEGPLTFRGAVNALEKLGYDPQEAERIVNEWWEGTDEAEAERIASDGPEGEHR